MIFWHAGGKNGTDMGKKKKIEIRKVEDSRPYVLWRRVSTEEQGESGLGLEAQASIAKLFMQRDPIRIYTDVYSGTKLRQCERLWEAIDLCKKENYLLVIAKSDRFRSVQDALDILDAVGEKNLLFCDLPSTDRFVLTIMWAVWEKQALMGRINTKIALEERKKQIARDGGFISKAGRWTTHLGSLPGSDTSRMRAAATSALCKLSADWREDSPLYAWVTIQIYKGRERKEILAEAAEMYKKNPERFCTRQGKALSKGVLSIWAREIQKK